MPHRHARHPHAADENLLRAWKLLYDYQCARIRKTYSDHEDTADIQSLFFDYVYVDPAARARFDKRNETFIRIARSKLFRMITNHELHEYLETVIALKELTDKLDIAAARVIASSPDAMENESLDSKTYRHAITKSSTKADRIKRLDMVMRSFNLCNRVIHEMSFSLEEVLRFTPKIFMRNSDLINLCVMAYRAFSKHKPRLDEYEKLILEKETAHINKLFGRD